MSKKAQFYIGLIIASGAGLVATCLAAESAVPHSAGYLVYCLLAWLASALKVRLPGLTGTISLNFLFILIAVAVFSFSETVLLAAVGCVVQCVWRPRKRPHTVQVAFNVAVLSISSGAAYRVSHFLSGTAAAHLAIQLIVAASFYFTADTLLVSGVLALVENKSLFAVWQQCYLWSFPYYIAGAALSALAVETDRSSGWLMSLVVLIPMCLIYVFYRLCVEKLTQRTV